MESTQLAWCGRYWANAPGHRVIRTSSGSKATPSGAKVGEHGVEHLVVAQMEHLHAVATERDPQDLAAAGWAPVRPLLRAERCCGDRPLGRLRDEVATQAAQALGPLVGGDVECDHDDVGGLRLREQPRRLGRGRGEDVRSPRGRGEDHGIERSRRRRVVGRPPCRRSGASGRRQFGRTTRTVAPVTTVPAPARTASAVARVSADMPQRGAAKIGLVVAVAVPWALRWRRAANSRLRLFWARDGELRHLGQAESVGVGGVDAADE